MKEGPMTRGKFVNDMERNSALSCESLDTQSVYSQNWKKGRNCTVKSTQAMGSSSVVYPLTLMTYLTESQNEYDRG